MRLITYRTPVLFLAVLFLATAVYAGDKSKDPPPQGSPSRNASYLPDVVIVKIKAGQTFQLGLARTGIPLLDTLLQRAQTTRTESFLRKPSGQVGTLSADDGNISRMVKIHYASAVDPEVLCQELRALPEVEYAEPYILFRVHYIPNDPALSQQWAIDALHLKEAWDVTKGDSTIVIGDVDTGVDWTHEDLSLNIWNNPGETGLDALGHDKRTNGIDDDNDGKVDDYMGWDFVGSGTATNPIPDNNPMDGAMGHGTWTSSCFGARTDNGIGIASSSFRSKILPVKVAGDAETNLSAGYDGIIYAADMGCKIINCSWGAYTPYNQAMLDVISHAYLKGALLVVSGGNDPVDNDYTPSYPSSFDHVLNVGSIETSGAASTWCNYGTSVAVCAPGNSVYMAQKGGGYSSQQGTSFSAPLTSGVAALVWTVHPDWTPDQVAKQIRVTCDPFTTPPQSKHFGKVNAFKAVSLNKTLSDIPGIRIHSATIATPSGTQFTVGGQTATLTVTLENVLAPTSAAATATVDLDDAQLTTKASAFPLGVLPTFGTKTITFDVTLAQNPSYSEGFAVTRLRINDGAYIDYLIVRIPIYIQDAWHSVISLGVPAFSSIDVLSATSIWATANLSSQTQDLCIRSADAGASWYNASGTNFPSGKGVYCVCGVNGTTALVGTGPSTGAAEIWRTANGGTSWTGTSVSAITAFVDYIHMFDAQNGIFVGDPKSSIWGIGKTTDGGATWTAVTPKTSAASTTEASWNNAADFVGDIGWFGTNNSRIYRTTDRGQTWKSYATPSMHSVDLSFRDPYTGMIRFSQQNSTGTNALALTTDGGLTWKILTTLTTTATGALAMERNGQRTWVMQNGNAYVSTNLGATWSVEPVPSSFGNLTVSDIFSSTSTTDIWTAGLDIFRYHDNFDPMLAVDPPSSLATNLAIASLYPNPVSTVRGQVVAQFSLPTAGMALFEVYDESGMPVRRVNEAVLAPGNHALTFSLAGLPTGTYFCRLSAGGSAVAKRLVVIH